MFYTVEIINKHSLNSSEKKLSHAVTTNNDINKLELICVCITCLIIRESLVKAVKNVKAKYMWAFYVYF